uniref:Uncharacterized protein n=1 Tax=Solanum lycopersicum TaxID=4081 RepID=A0A3Q7G749_SOLLC
MKQEGIERVNITQRRNSEQTIYYNPKRTGFCKQDRDTLQALEPAWITSPQVEAGIFPDKLVTLRPKKTCILYEIGVVIKNIARRAILVVASKMPIRTQFIIS